MLVSFPSSEHNTQYLQLKVERFNLAHDLRTFSAWSGAPRQKLHERRAEQNKTAQFMVARKHNRRTVPDRKGLGTTESTQSHVSMSTQTHQGACFLDLLIVYESNES